MLKNPLGTRFGRHVAGDERKGERWKTRSRDRRARLIGPLRRDGFLLNVEPLAHVRSFHSAIPDPFFLASLRPLFLHPCGAPHQSANHNFYQSHLRVTIVRQSLDCPDAFCLPIFSRNALRAILPRASSSSSSSSSSSLVLAYFDHIPLMISRFSVNSESRTDFLAVVRVSQFSASLTCSTCCNASPSQRSPLSARKSGAKRTRVYAFPFSFLFPGKESSFRGK